MRAPHAEIAKKYLLRAKGHKHVFTNHNTRALGVFLRHLCFALKLFFSFLRSILALLGHSLESKPVNTHVLT